MAVMNFHDSPTIGHVIHFAGNRNRRAAVLGQFSCRIQRRFRTVETVDPPALPCPRLLCQG